MAPPRGFVHSEEAKEKIRAAMRARYQERPDIVERMAAGARAPRSKTARERYAAAQMRDYGFLSSLSITDRSYIAGLFDGEGSVSIVKRSGRRNLIIMMSIGNTHRGVLDWIQEKLRGNLSEMNRSGNWKSGWKWSATQRHAEEILRLLQPYLIIKAKQASVALAFQADRFADEETTQMYRLQMGELNRRGKEVV